MQTIRLVSKLRTLSPKYNIHDVILFQVLQFKLLLLKINRKFEIHILKVDNRTIAKAAWGKSQFGVPYQLGWVSGLSKNMPWYPKQYRILTKYLTIRKIKTLLYTHEITYKMSLL